MSIVVPELNECQTHAATLEETVTNIREAIERFLETLPDEARG
jgi:predicted RNase H-like HicB family nuclease